VPPAPAYALRPLQYETIGGNTSSGKHVFTVAVMARTAIPAWWDLTLMRSIRKTSAGSRAGAGQCLEPFATASACIGRGFAMARGERWRSAMIWQPLQLIDITATR